MIWAINVGGSGDDAGLGIVADSAGVVYVTGGFTGTVDFNSGTGVYTMMSSGSRDIFVLKLSTLGVFDWAGRSGGSSWDGGRNITLTSEGDVLISGWYS